MWLLENNLSHLHFRQQKEGRVGEEGEKHVMIQFLLASFKEPSWKSKAILPTLLFISY
jgi:hypothetical protein